MVRTGPRKRDTKKRKADRLRKEKSRRLKLLGIERADMWFGPRHEERLRAVGLIPRNSDGGAAVCRRALYTLLRSNFAIFRCDTGPSSNGLDSSSKEENPLVRIAQAGKRRNRI